MTGRLQTMTEMLDTRQGDLTRLMNERLDAVTQRMGQGLESSAKSTGDHLSKLNERLAVIDAAQNRLAMMTQEVVGLKDILANKQSRGAFGQAQMENIVRDALPNGLYEFQATLSNKSRPDCLIRLPNGAAPIVIDSKFPLECFEQLKSATGEPERKAASQRVKADIGKHVKDIADKYLIAGETQDPAIMFVPSESLYAELHDSFPDVIQLAYRSRVVVVSPNILMLAINTVQTVLKDARVREQANLIQREVQLLLRDVGLLTERVGKLQTHFDQANTDIKTIVTSAEKITARAEKIEKVDVGVVEETPKGATPLFPHAVAGQSR